MEFRRCGRGFGRGRRRLRRCVGAEFFQFGEQSGLSDVGAGEFGAEGNGAGLAPGFLGGGVGRETIAPLAQRGTVRETG